MVSWAKAGETPDVSECKNIDEVLAKIKTIAYGGRAEIHTINVHPVFYYKIDKTRKQLKEMGLELESFIEAKAKIFFDAELKPLLIKNKWKVSRSHMNLLILIEKDKNDEWDNVRDEEKEFKFEYLCKEFLSRMSVECERFTVNKFFNLMQDLGDFYLELPN